jgi:hypothetical protein
MIKSIIADNFLILTYVFVSHFVIIGYGGSGAATGILGSLGGSEYGKSKSSKLS